MRAIVLAEAKVHLKWALSNPALSAEEKAILQRSLANVEAEIKAIQDHPDLGVSSR